MPLGAEPWSFVRTAPYDAADLLPPDIIVVPACSSRLVIERRIAHLSMCCDNAGSNSPIWIPGTFVLMVPYGPRMLTGAPGFGSNVSRWLGPPLRKMKMQDGWRPAVREAGLACNSWPCQASASVRPSMPI